MLEYKDGAGVSGVFGEAAPAPVKKVEQKSREGKIGFYIPIEASKAIHLKSFSKLTRIPVQHVMACLVDQLLESEQRQRAFVAAYNRACEKKILGALKAKLKEMKFDK